MHQMGHAHPQMTYGVYSKVIRPEDRERLRALVGGGIASSPPDPTAVASV